MVLTFCLVTDFKVRAQMAGVLCSSFSSLYSGTHDKHDNDFGTIRKASGLRRAKTHYSVSLSEICHKIQNVYLTRDSVYIK